MQVGLAKGVALAGGGDGQVAKETSYDVAKKTSADLIKHIAEATKICLEAQGADAAPHIITQIKQAADAMKEQLTALEQRIPLAIREPPDYYKAMNDNAATQVSYFKDRCSFAKAIIQTAKRNESQHSLICFVANANRR